MSDKTLAFDYRYAKTTAGILKILTLIFNILAIKFVQSAEYPYYAVKGYIPFDALPIAAIVFSAITLTLLICIPRLQTSIIWLRYEWFILCCLITVYCYALIYFIGATVQCHDEAPDNRGCPWQLSALISAICAFVIYCIDIVYRTFECRRKSEAIPEGFSAATTSDDDEA